MTDLFNKTTPPTRLVHCLAGCLAFAILLLILGCQTGKTDMETIVSIPKKFSSSGETPLAEQWWLSLEDDNLNALIEKSLQQNFTLKSAWNKLDQAAALARKEGASVWPSLEGTAGLSRSVQRTKSTTGGGGNRTYQTEYSLGLSASYELDLWGRVQATKDASVLEAQATAEDLRAAALSLSGQIATAWYSLIEERAQLELLKQQIDTDKNYLDLLELRFKKGEVSATDILQQQKLLESSKTETSQVQSNIETIEHQLAVLTGQVPGQADLPSKSILPKLPALPDTGVPTEWMRARPDIRAAFLRVQSSNKDVAAAISNRFPRINITAGITTSAEKPSHLFEEWLANIAGSLTAPLFEGGARAAEVTRTKAVAMESLNNYAQTVLTGIQEVEDALSAERLQQESIRGLQKQLALSNQTFLQLVREFRNGTVDFLRVLDERQTQQGLQRSLLSAHAQLLQDRVDLCLALGGAWELERPVKTPPAKQENTDAQSIEAQPSESKGTEI